MLGLAAGGFGPVAVTSARLLVRMPRTGRSREAAAVPVAFLTAWYALADLAGRGPGSGCWCTRRRAAWGWPRCSIARHLGLEVYAHRRTGQARRRWPRLGLDEAHIASSRTPEFAEKFLAATGGRGVDIVLNSLAGELDDASLRLLPRGGRFIEMGKTDIRDAGAGRRATIRG